MSNGNDEDPMFLAAKDAMRAFETAKAAGASPDEVGALRQEALTAINAAEAVQEAESIVAAVFDGRTNRKST